MSKKQHTSIQGLLPFLTTAGIAGLILAVLAPYHTSQFGFVHRAIFWIGLCLAGGVGAAIGSKLLAKFRPKSTPWQTALVISITATLVVFSCLWLYHVSQGDMPTGWFYVLVPFYIWLISIIISGFGVLMDARKAASVDIRKRPEIFERLKPALRRAEIFALTSEDHYVRVITSQGDDLILMRLSDAIKETAPLPGLKVHRSWWVAEAGVRKVSRSDGKLTITLKSDTDVPVSRSNAKIVRQAGWL